ncbi:MAG: Ig-like domain-containing protein [Polyangia bacterium]
MLFALGAASLGAAGCDDVSAGQPSDSKDPPQLVHVLVQDARYLLSFPNRASSLDLLDNNPFGNRACTIECKGNCPANPGDTPPAQLDTCVTEWLVDQLAPNVACTAAGVCTDPLKVPSSGVPVPLPMGIIGLGADMRDPGGGIQVRLVFDKVLDSSIETVVQDNSKAPGKTFTYMVTPGIVELDDESGKPVPAGIYLDNGGSPQFSSDLELVPLGPALVIKPNASLDAHTTYTVKIGNGGAIKDRQGNAAVGLGGGALPTSLKFTTEDLTPAVAGAFGSGIDFPDFSAPATITPNEVIQIGFYENAAGDTATVDFTSAPAGVKPIAFSDRGGDASACTKAEPGNILVDVANSDTGNLASAVAVDWPAGNYTFTITVKDINGKSTFTSDPMTFTVAGTDEADPTVDPNIAAAHLTPSQCSM